MWVICLLKKLRKNGVFPLEACNYIAKKVMLSALFCAVERGESCFCGAPEAQASC